MRVLLLIVSPMANRDLSSKPDVGYARSRFRCGLIILILIVLGLSSRKIEGLPEFIKDHAGDALWAAMIYWGLAFLLPARSMATLAVAAIGFCFAIEFSQLIHHPLLDRARATTLGALVLGHGFLWIDLVRYTGGTIAAAALDTLVNPKSKPWIRLPTRAGPS